MARRSSHDRVRTGSRRRTGWEEGPGTQTLVSLTTSGSSVVGLGFSTSIDGFTVARMRGYVEMFLNAAVGADGNGFAGAIGIGIVSSAAFAVGITAMPTPITEITWEGWLYHRFFSLHSSDITAGDVDHRNESWEIDSKAMRKLDSDDTIFVAVEATETGTAQLNVRVGTRMLMFLP